MTLEDGEPSHARGSGSLERVTTNLTRKTAEALSVAMNVTGDTKTHTINKAIQLYALLQQILAEGGSMSIRRAGEKESKQLFMF